MEVSFNKIASTDLNNHIKSDIGLIPKDWVIRTLEEVVQVIDPHPSHRAPAEMKKGIPFLGIGDLDENGNIIKEDYRIVSEEIFEQHSKRYNLNDNLIGLGRVASIGKVVRLKNNIGKYTVSPTLGVLKPINIDPDFLFFILSSHYVRGYFNKIMSGSTRSSVGMIVLRKIPMPLPPTLAEQRTISSHLLEITNEIKALELKIEKFQMIKQGLMQELLTGKTRLI